MHSHLGELLRWLIVLDHEATVVVIAGIILELRRVLVLFVCILLKHQVVVAVVAAITLCKCCLERVDVC